MIGAFRVWAEQERARFLGQLSFDEPLSKYTYYRIGGPASALAIPQSLAELKWLHEGIQATGVPYYILGLGSNVLVSDSGYSGLIIRTSRIGLGINETGKDRLHTGASVAVSSLLRRAAQDGWDGLEFLTGIPGSIGGVVAMNAGTHLGEAKDRLRRVEIFSLKSGESRVAENTELRFEYRKNLFLGAEDVVVGAEWEISRGEPKQIKEKIAALLERRKASQPVDYPSCGSVFKNPREKGLSAWQVVDQVGLRGHKIGDAQFSEKHPNFILNLGQARASDVRALIELARERARTQLGVELHEEVKYLGQF